MMLMIFVNFKTYKEGSGENAVKLAGHCKAVSLEYGVPIYPVVQTLDIYKILQIIQIPLFVQHADPVSFGKYTGFINPYALKESGVMGVILNHSEHSLSQQVLKHTVYECKKAELKTLVCFSETNHISEIILLQPDFVAFEPPELIASETDSVVTKYSEKIKDIVNMVNPVPIIVGAGIKAIEDIQTSIKQGARGVLVSSAIVTAPDQKNALLTLAKGFKNN
jgi:triosephosphate isomerase